eukprot:5950692-Prymnesium_polylepis.1
MQTQSHRAAVSRHGAFAQCFVRRLHQPHSTSCVGNDAVKEVCARSRSPSPTPTRAHAHIAKSLIGSFIMYPNLWDTA